ncbi:sensor histidine kinase [Kitasatospora sp. McL0602]|uniref:sensor histidine kinase n=1 Tax=Kitasatospora sp. McL0602 TaxID=3439530 RepID=UPI003F8B78EB
MPVTSPLPRLRHVPPVVWAALTWCAATVYTLFVRIRLPGESERFSQSGEFMTTVAWTYLAASTAFAVAAFAVLSRRQLLGLGLLLCSAVTGAMVMNSSEINFIQYLPVDVVVYLVAITRRRSAAVTALGMALGVLIGYSASRLLLGFRIGTLMGLAVALTTLVSWLLGLMARQARDHAEMVGAQAAAQAVTDERLRIARELHDMVAHTIGIVALQSGAAKLVIETQPQRARTALGEVEAASRETLAGLRRMLGALRHAESEAGGEAEPPVQGLADLERLAATTTAAGVRVELRRQGERRQLPAEIDLAAYRIAQESVTNVVRHSAARTCQVTVDHTHDTLTVEITDPGPSAAGSTGGTGYGLLGMRERVTLLHGEFTAAPHPQGGFRVTARLPLPTA